MDHAGRPVPGDDDQHGDARQEHKSRYEPSDRQRRTAMLRLLGAGGVVAIVATVALAMTGADGRAGFQSMLVFGGFGSMVAALTGLAGAISDQARQRPISLRRGLLILTCFGLSLLCLMMLAALAGNGRLPE